MCTCMCIYIYTYIHDAGLCPPTHGIPLQDPRVGWGLWSAWLAPPRCDVVPAVWLRMLTSGLPPPPMLCIAAEQLPD